MAVCMCQNLSKYTLNMYMSIILQIADEDDGVMVVYICQNLSNYTLNMYMSIILQIADEDVRIKKLKCLI